MAEIAANDDKLVMNLYMRPQKGKANAVKTNMESTSASVEEPGLNSGYSNEHLKVAWGPK